VDEAVAVEDVALLDRPVLFEEDAELVCLGRLRETTDKNLGFLPKKRRKAPILRFISRYSYEDV
jgi:hypothetical protein